MSNLNTYKNYCVAFLVFVLFVGISSCKKDKTYGSGMTYNPDCENSFVDPVPGSAGFIQYYEDSVQFKMASFNPNNKNEIVYQYMDWTNYIFEIRKYNLITHTTQTLVTDFLMDAKPEWNSNGVIAFNNSGGVIYTVNDDGSNFSQFTSFGGSWNFAWAWGNKLIFNHVNQENGQRSNLIKSIGSAVHDTIMPPGNGFYKFIISSNNTFLSSEAGPFYSKQLVPNTTYVISDFQIAPNQLIGSSEGLTWHPSGTKFYTSVYPNGEGGDPGLYEVQYPSGISKRLIKYCDSKRYDKISCSPDGKFLVAERLDCTQEFNSMGNFNGYIERKTSIYLFNLATRQEIKVNLE